MKIKYVKIYSTTLLIGIFTFLASSSGKSSSNSSNEEQESMKIDIKNTSEVKKFLQGKWIYTELAASDSENKYYRIEITETHIIFNWKLGWSSKFDQKDEEIYDYQLSDVYPGDNEGNYERFISVIGDKSLGYRMVDPLKISQNYDGTIGLYIPGHIYEFERVNQGSKDYWTSNINNLKSKNGSSESNGEMEYSDENFENAGSNNYTNSDDRFSKVTSMYNTKMIKYDGINYLLFTKSISLSQINDILSENFFDSEGVVYRLPTDTQMKSLFKRNSEVGTGFYKNGIYYKAKMPKEFNNIGEAVWFWVNVESGQACVNMFNATTVDFERSSMNFPVHALLVGEYAGC